MKVELLQIVTLAVQLNGATRVIADLHRMAVVNDSDGARLVLKYKVGQVLRAGHGEIDGRLMIAGAVGMAGAERGPMLRPGFVFIAPVGLGCVLRSLLFRGFGGKLLSGFCGRLRCHHFGDALNGALDSRL